jgi:hypothetical protein
LKTVFRVSFSQKPNLEGGGRKVRLPLPFLNMKTIILLILCLLSMSEAEAIDIAATGGWTETVDASNLISGAGSNLTSTYTSPGNATTITLTNTKNKNDNWRVNVRRVDSTWNSNLTLYVRRTSNGTGAGGISGGTTFIQILSSDQQFFSGSGDRNGISCQYRLTGMSINVDPGTYSTTVIYTMVDI